MVTKSAKKAQIRTLIMNAAHAYAKELAGKVFLYVYGNDYLEISFRKECFARKDANWNLDLYRYGYLGQGFMKDDMVR